MHARKEAIGMLEPLWALVVAAGVPSAILGVYMRRMEKKMDKKEEARETYEMLTLKSVNASIALGEATAEAMKRIPEAKCNGDMENALEYAKKVKHEMKDFIGEQAVHSIM